MIKFTQIPSKLKYPPFCKAKLSTLHSGIITYVMSNFERTAKYRNQVLKVMNTLSYIMLSGDSMPIGWTSEDPFTNIEYVDDIKCRTLLQDLYLIDRNIEWDVPDNLNLHSSENVNHSVTSKPIFNTISHVDNLSVSIDTGVTSKTDLYIKPPIVPRFDTNKPWLSYKVGLNKCTIYSTLPEIPTRQNEISVTTDVNKFAKQDLLNLFPNCFIPTRASVMYTEVSNLSYDSDVGIIIPISGYTDQQIKDNIIKYPHIFRLLRYVDDKFVSFYQNIEIDGKLYDISDTWSKLPDTSDIPKTPEFIKEYVVRRYLLERDIDKLEHKYPLFGSLDPFLTLFTTADDYVRLGYSDIEDIARQCVKARVSYKQSRNPILRRLKNE